MNKILTLLIVLFAFGNVVAQAPQKMNYQAVIRNSSNELVASVPVSVRISILKDSDSGMPVYVETQTKMTNGNGLLTLEIGTGTVISGTFSTINWGAASHFIKTETDPSGGSDFTIIGTSQLMSVPYAFYATSSGSGSSGTSGSNIGDMQYWDGSAWINIPIGQPGQYLQISDIGIPQWSGTRKPTLTTGIPTFIGNGQSYNYAYVTSNVTSTGGAEFVTSIGVCWSLTPNPTVDDFKAFENSNFVTGPFDTWMRNLTPGVTYYIRAFATSSAGIGYGNEVVYHNPALHVPLLQTDPVTDITSGTGKANGYLLAPIGGSPIQELGFCWDTSPNPTIEGIHAQGENTLIMNQLLSNTTYYVRAYGINGSGVGYGNEVSFTTNNLVEIGARHQGGIIAYIFKNGDSGYVEGEIHGLIASPTDIGLASWGCQGTLLNATGENFGTGNQNTNIIISGCADLNTAAKLCSDLNVNGYSDWYLPSINELEKMSLSKFLVGGYDFWNGPGMTPNYWSSTESHPLRGSYFSFILFSSRMEALKSSQLNVRAVRQF